jgi:microcystin-dependent protein
MKEQWEKECAALRAEMAALQQQVQALGGQQASAKTSARWRLFKSPRIVWLPVFVLLSAAGVLYGQGAMDALYIDSSGNVGVGTTTPQGFQVALPEKNKAAAPNAGITLAGGPDGNASIELRGKDRSTPYIDFASSSQDYDARIRLTAPAQLAIEGASVGIGRPDPQEKLHVAGPVLAEGFRTASGVSLAGVQDGVKMLVPIGTIMAYGGDTGNPTVVAQLGKQGWLPCDGAVVSRQDYVDLFAALGTAFGADAQTFRVPDLRGRFLRGTDQGQGRDPDAGRRRAEAGGANSGDRVGSVQDDEFKAHTHSYTLFPADHGQIASGNYWRSGEAQTGSAGGNETRPKNVNVNWIIKAKHLPAS